MNKDYFDDEFIITLTIEGTLYKDVEVKITDPNKTIRDQISCIVSVFKLSMFDNGGNLVQYLLAQIMEDDGEEPVILEFEDEDGREQCLMDYNVQPGDHLHLISVPIAGTPTIPLFEIEIIDANITALEIINSICSEWDLKCYYKISNRRIKTLVDINFYGKVLKEIYWHSNIDDYFFPIDGVYKTINELGVSPMLSAYVCACYHPGNKLKLKLTDRIKSILKNWEIKSNSKVIKGKSFSYKWINPNIIRIIK